MTITNIALQRLNNQHLIDPLGKPDEVVRSLGAVQSQDFHGAKWALGQRCIRTTGAAITNLYNEGKILRTHILRPTWHFVSPEDIRWMQELTAPRVHARNLYYYNQFGLDESTLNKGCEILERALTGGNELTRDELKDVFLEAGITAEGPKLAYLIMYAELEAQVCSGRMKGKQHTIALLSERAPQARSLPRLEALTELVKRFFTSHGPAVIQDLVWWSGLSTKELETGIRQAGLQEIKLENKTFYFAEE